MSTAMHSTLVFLITAPVWAEKLPASDSSGDASGVDPQVLKALGEAIPGTPGTDYPLYAEPPQTSFVCDGYIDGYYADTEARCQAFHVCSSDGIGGLNKFSFICPNGTIFNQQYFICDWWFNVDCSQ